MGEKFRRNVARGVSVESQLAEWRLEHLRYIPAAIRFLSCEPLVGPLSIKRYLPDLDWVIVGGESGPKARIMQIEWAQKLRDECAEFARIAFFRSEEHTSELQSLMRTSYAVFCLKK